MSGLPAYTRTAIALHWLMAALVFASLLLGWLVHEMALSPDKLRLLSYHKWLGVTLLMLLVARVLWRFTHQPTPMPDSISLWQRRLAQIVHVLLYLLLFLIPLSGWLMSSAKGFQTVYFGVLPLPDLIGKDRALGETLAGLHELLNITLVVLLVGHVGAALRHHFMDGDGTLGRMIPWLNRRNAK